MERGRQAQGEEKREEAHINCIYFLFLDLEQQFVPFNALA